MNFRVDEDESSQKTLTVVLEMAQSLSIDSDENTYALTAVMRAAGDEAGQIQGAVNVNCGTGQLAQVAAVYLFAGENQQPDDRDLQGDQPYAVTQVTSSIDGASRYTLPSIPQGDYTIAIACRGNAERPDTDEDLDFRRQQNVRLDSNETLIVDIS